MADEQFGVNDQETITIQFVAFDETGAFIADESEKVLGRRWLAVRAININPRRVCD
ncbi:hypothetical protein [Candidatus Aquicultor secundus]|uniref:hypothetical protein n=1 Tax=Candidatus Aquicultor secundus TaxID=1973895 RepID=UPI00257CED74|nr:hypothetical protein [Candidatus Aquicultor secundus]